MDGIIGIYRPIVFILMASDVILQIKDLGINFCQQRMNNKESQRETRSEKTKILLALTTISLVLLKR